VLKAEGDHVSFWVVDDDAWPLVLWRDEDENYWHLAGRGGDVPLERKRREDTERKLVVERAKVTRKAVPKSEAGIVATLRGKGSERDRIKAVGLAAKSRTRETLEALVHSVRDTYGVWSEAKEVLAARSAEPDFLPLVHAVLEKEAAQAKPENKGRVDVHDSRCRQILELMQRPQIDMLAHAPLATSVRALARTHPSKGVRDWARIALAAARGRGRSPARRRGS
jgi:hypothetical protein